MAFVQEIHQSSQPSVSPRATCGHISHRPCSWAMQGISNLSHNPPCSMDAPLTPVVDDLMLTYARTSLFIHKLFTALKSSTTFSPFAHSTNAPQRVPCCPSVGAWPSTINPLLARVRATFIRRASERKPRLPAVFARTHERTITCSSAMAMAELRQPL